MSATCPKGSITAAMFSELMPMPVSRTLMDTESRLSLIISSEMLPPDGVNLTALETKLTMICLMCRGSALSRTSWPGNTRDNMTPLSSVCSPGKVMADSTKSGRSTVSSESFISPASIREMSRMSLMTSRRWVPDALISPAYSKYLGMPMGPNNWDFKVSEKPIMEFSGVLNSWLMLARNTDLA